MHTESIIILQHETLIL